MELANNEYLYSTFIDIEEANEAYDFSKRNPCYRSLRDNLFKILFSEGIRSLDENIQPTSVFHDVLNRHWIKFAKEVLDSFLVFGFAVYEFIPVFVHLEIDGKRKRRKRKVYIPHVPVYGSYKVQVRLSKKTKMVSLHIYDQDDIFYSQENKDMRYLVFENSLPCPRTGRLHSKISCLLKHAAISNQMTMFSLQSEYIRSRPTIYTKSEKDNKKSSNDENDFFNSVTAIESLSEKNMIRKNENSYLNRDIMDQQNQYVNTNSNHDKLNLVSSTDFKIRLLPQWQNNIFHLPQGTEMASSSNTSGSRIDFTALEKTLERNIFSILGFPAAFLSSVSDGNKVSIKNSMDILTLRRSINGYQTSIEHSINNVYEMLYGNDEGFKMALTISPLIDQNEIINLHEEGVITSKQKGEYLMKVAGLPSDHVIEENETGVKIPDVNSILLLYREGAINEETKVQLLLKSTGVDDLDLFQPKLNPKNTVENLQSANKLDDENI